MLDLMPKISENLEQLGGVEVFIEKYKKAEIQFFSKKDEPHEFDFSKIVEYLCTKYNMEEITIHPPLKDYDIEYILCYDENIIKNQLEELANLSEKFNIKLNLIYHTHWHLAYHKAITVDKIKNLLKIIEGKRVKILIENLFMMHELMSECSALLLCKEIDHPNLRMCMDICHLHCQANMYKEDINNWMERKFTKEDCEKYIYQIHFSYTGNNDGYKDKKTHGIGHPNKELLFEDFKILEKYGISNKQIVTEIAEKDYNYREAQIQDILWLENLEI